MLFYSFLEFKCFCYNAGLHQEFFSRTTPQESDSALEKITNFASLVKSAFGIFYVYLVSLFCYLPHLIFCRAAIETNGPSSIASRSFYPFSATLAYLINSLLNPVIYCWKLRHIRHVIIDSLRNTSWLKTADHSNRRTGHITLVNANTNANSQCKYNAGEI